MTEMRDMRNTLCILLTIERQCMALCEQCRGLASALESETGDSISASHLRRLVSGLDVAVTSLLTGVASQRDTSGTHVDVLGELAMRVGTFTLLLQLDIIGAALAREPTPERARRLFSGRLQSFDAVAELVLNDVARQHRLWLRYRLLVYSAATAAMANGHREDGYHELLRSARHDILRSLSQLGFDPDFAHFLAVGMAMNDSPDVSRACQEIAAIVNDQLHADLAEPAHWGAEPEISIYPRSSARGASVSMRGS